MCQVELANGANLSLSWWKDPPGMTVWLCELMTLHSFCRGYISTPWGLIYAQPNSDSHSAELLGLWRGLRKQHKTLLKSLNYALVHLYSSLKIPFSFKKKKRSKGSKCPSLFIQQSWWPVYGLSFDKFTYICWPGRQVGVFVGLLWHESLLIHYRNACLMMRVGSRSHKECVSPKHT